MSKKSKISFQEFAEKMFPEEMKNTFHAEFIKWLSDETKDLPNGTHILLNHGRPKSYYNPMALKRDVGIKVDNGLHLDTIIFDDGKKQV